MTVAMANIGDVRKTSNGCEVAKRVPRKKSCFRVPSDNVAAIDFGTTNCSVAYRTVGSGPEEGPRRLPLNTTYYRVPTAVLFKPDGTIDSFGKQKPFLPPTAELLLPFLAQGVESKVSSFVSQLGSCDCHVTSSCCTPLVARGLHLCNWGPVHALSQQTYQ